MTEEKKNTKGILIAIISIVVIAGLVYLLSLNSKVTENIRDIFVIFLAFFTLLIGIAVVVLVVQVSKLVNMLNNEVKPMVESTNRTLRELQGTTHFIGSNLVEPVIKINSTVAGIQKAVDLLNIFK